MLLLAVVFTCGSSIGSQFTIRYEWYDSPGDIGSRTLLFWSGVRAQKKSGWFGYSHLDKSLRMQNIRRFRRTAESASHLLSIAVAVRMDFCVVEWERGATIYQYLLWKELDYKTIQWKRTSREESRFLRLHISRP